MKQIQSQKQQSLNKMKLGLDTFYNVLEPLEEYIEKSGDFPGFINKRQVYRKNIQDGECPLEVDEDLFLSNLFIFARTFHGKPASFMKIIQEDFYKWINAVGITFENCPEKLKHFLIEIDNILEGNDEKIVQETRERNEGVEINPWDMPKIFAGLQNPLNKNREQAKVLKGKKWNELSEEDRLKGDVELGKRAFEQIKLSISIPHDKFRLRGLENQGDEMKIDEFASSSSYQQSNSLENQYNFALRKWNEKRLEQGETADGLQRWIALLEFKLDKGNWKLDWVKKFRGSWSQQPIWELALISPDASLSEENGYDYLGNLKDAYNVQTRKVHLVNFYPVDQQNELRKSRKNFVLNEYEIFQKKVQGEIPMLSWETEKGVIDWGKKLESEIKSQNYLRNSQQPTKQNFSQPIKSNNNQLPKTPLIIGGVGFGVLLTGLIVYKVIKKNKVRN